jgi:hypothetical protein
MRSQTVQHKRQARTTKKALDDEGPKARGSLVSSKKDKAPGKSKKARATTPEDKGPQAKGSMLPEGPNHLQSEGSTLVKEQPQKSNSPKDKGPKARGSL